MDTTIFYVALFVHLSCLILGFGSVMVIDTFGLLWLFKKAKMSFIMKVAETTQKLIWVGWSGMILSGLILITSKGYVDNLTKIKLFFVLMVGINGILLHRLKKWSEQIGDNPVPPRLFFRTMLSTAISQTGWWGALLIGFLHRHIEHTITWPANPYLWMFAIIGIFGAAAIIGETTIKKS